MGVSRFVIQEFETYNVLLTSDVCTIQAWLTGPAHLISTARRPLQIPATASIPLSVTPDIPETSRTSKLSSANAARILSFKSPRRLASAIRGACGNANVCAHVRKASLHGCMQRQRLGGYVKNVAYHSLELAVLAEPQTQTSESVKIINIK
jgi:hypothetical protein